MLRLAVIFAVAMTLSGCDACGNDPIKSLSSPDGRWKAVLFQRDCGATTSDSSQVSLLHSTEELPNSAGNLFIADREPSVRFAWLSNNILEIHYRRAARTFKKEQRAGNIAIQYVAD